MSEVAFLQALLDEPEDRTTRLVFADWLDDRGDPRGEFLRVETELAGWVPDHRRRNEMLTRRRQLLADHEANWLGPLRVFANDWLWENGLAYLSVDASCFVTPEFARVAEEWFPRAWVGGAWLPGARRVADALAASRHLRWLPALNLYGEGLYDVGLAGLMASPHLDRLTRLGVGENGLGRRAARALCNAPVFGRLKGLDLRNNRLTSSDLRPLLSALSRSRLRTLDLHGNDLDAPALLALSEWQRQSGTEGLRFTNSIGMEFARVPAGSFLMGSPETEAQRYDDEGPRRPVTLTRPFYMGVYAVTQRQYERVMGDNPSAFTFPGLEWEAHLFPVDSVSWLDAVEFCRRLSALPEEKALGRVYRLPTEAEWEHACRAGGDPSWPFHYGTSLAFWLANFNANYPYGGAPAGGWLEQTTYVGTYRPNAFGLFDMHGNTWEWCADGMDHSFYRNSPAADPVAPHANDERVCRGGSWHSPGHYCRSADRGSDRLDVRDRFYGFRVACDLSDSRRT